MWAEVAVAGGFVGFNGLILRWFSTRMNKMESTRRTELYQPNGQTNYITRSECGHQQEMFCNKIEELKRLLISMDKKRVEAKDELHENQRIIGERLAGIEAKL